MNGLLRHPPSNLRLQERGLAPTFAARGTAVAREARCHQRPGPSQYTMLGLCNSVVYTNMSSMLVRLRDCLVSNGAQSPILSYTAKLIQAHPLFHPGGSHSDRQKLHRAAASEFSHLLLVSSIGLSGERAVLSVEPVFS